MTWDVYTKCRALSWHCKIHFPYNKYILYIIIVVKSPRLQTKKKVCQSRKEQMNNFVKSERGSGSFYVPSKWEKRKFKWKALKHLNSKILPFKVPFSYSYLSHYLSLPLSHPMLFFLSFFLPHLLFGLNTINTINSGGYITILDSGHNGVKVIRKHHVWVV